jgi:UMF1 family MFS transporter
MPGPCTTGKLSVQSGHHFHYFPAYFEAITRRQQDLSKTTITFLGRQFENTSLYNYALAVAMLIVAVISPLLSSIADYRGNKKNFMNFFLTMEAFHAHYFSCLILLTAQRPRLRHRLDWALPA